MYSSHSTAMTSKEPPGAGAGAGGGCTAAANKAAKRMAGGAAGAARGGGAAAAAGWCDVSDQHAAIFECIGFDDAVSLAHTSRILFHDGLLREAIRSLVCEGCGLKAAGAPCAADSECEEFDEMCLDCYLKETSWRKPALACHYCNAILCLNHEEGAKQDWTLCSCACAYCPACAFDYAGFRCNYFHSREQECFNKFCVGCEESRDECSCRNYGSGDGDSDSDSDS